MEDLVKIIALILIAVIAWKIFKSIVKLIVTIAIVLLVYFFISNAASQVVVREVPDLISDKMKSTCSFSNEYKELFDYESSTNSISL